MWFLRGVMILAGLVLVVMTGVLVVVRRGEANSHLFFFSDEQGLHRMLSDGSARRRITLDQEYASFIQWSPDGRQIAYLAYNDDDASPQVILSSPAGKNRRVMPVENEFHLAWSPDSRWLALSAGFFTDIGRNDSIILIPSDGGERRIIEGAWGQVFWSPDSRWLLAQEHELGNFYRIPLDGGAPIQLTDLFGTQFQLGISSDGEWIFFMGENGDEYGLYRVRSDGSAVEKLADFTVVASLRWSPDLEWIVFVASTGDGRLPGDIYRSRPDGSEMRNLTNSPNSHELSPAFSADGEWIVFTSIGENTPEIYRMRLDGSDVQRLIQNLGWDDWSLVWSPDRAWLLVQMDDNFPATIRPDGSDFNKLVDACDSRQFASPVWSPDGEWLIFHTCDLSYSTPLLNINRIRPDGTGFQRIAANTNYAYYDRGWSPPINLPWRFWLDGAVGLILLAVGVKFSMGKGG